MTIEAIIFDCDGVLIDSEYLACEVSAAALREIGYEITTEQYIDLFIGRKYSETIKILASESGIPADKFLSAGEKDKKREQVFEEKLKMTAHTKEVLDAVQDSPLSYCIASGSSMKRLDHSLKVVGLDQFFCNKVFSSDVVDKGKPAPDIFIYAADKIGAAPENCLVIEDSPYGIQAGLAANMNVVGYSGATHMNDDRIEKLYHSGAKEVISDMRLLINYI